jgi:hypothetical protein
MPASRKPQPKAGEKIALYVADGHSYRNARIGSIRDARRAGM